MDEARACREQVPDEPRPAVVELELRQPEEPKQLGTRAWLLRGVEDDLSHELVEVGAAGELCDLGLEVPRPSDPELARVVQVVPRGDVVERRAHHRRAHDLTTLDGAHEQLAPEPLEARPQRDVRGRRPLRLERADALDRAWDGEPGATEQELAGEERAVQLTPAENALAAHTATLPAPSRSVQRRLKHPQRAERFRTRPRSHAGVRRRAVRNASRKAWAVSGPSRLPP